MANNAPAQTDSIFVVEDTNFMRLLIERILKGFGHRVKTFSSVTAALDALQRNVPKLLFLDLHLSDGNGLDLCKTLRADPVYKDLPIIVCTIDHTRPSVQAAIAAGATDFLCKPVDRNNLGERLIKHLGPNAAPGLADSSISRA
jgi:CheY-like chemotaxis protein